jgi:type VI secretion system protein ImpJ
MELARPPFWHQGLFLQPQHLQWQDLAVEGRFAALERLMHPYFWGVAELTLGDDALRRGTIRLLKGRFLFPDGALVELGKNAFADDRTLDDAAASGGRPVDVWLGLAKMREDAANTTVLEKNAPSADAAGRFVTREDPDEIPDLHGGGAPGRVRRMDYHVKIFWGSERDRLGDYALLPIARLERAGTAWELSPNYIPPSLTLRSSATLTGILKEISDEVATRARRMEEHKSQRGIHAAEFGSRDMVYVLALRTLSRAIPWLRHWMTADTVHPWNVYGGLRQLVGELSCFSEGIGALGERGQDGPLPDYDPLRLWDGFSRLQSVLGTLLDEISSEPDHIIPLIPENGGFVGELRPALAESPARFYLAVTSPMEAPAALASLTAGAKLGSLEDLPTLVARSLPGVPLEPLAVPPRELPRRSRTVYFAVDTGGERWASVKKSRRPALNWDGAPEGARVELMAVSRS